MTGTRVAYTRAGQTVENNDEAGCNACYYLHFLSRRDVRASIRARDATGMPRTKEKATLSRSLLKEIAVRGRFLMMIQHANKSLMPTQRRRARTSDSYGSWRDARETRSACGFIIIYALSLHLLAPTGRIDIARCIPTRTSDEVKKDERLCPPSASTRQERIGALIFTDAFSMRIRHADASLTVFRMASDMRYPVRYFTPSRSRREPTQ